MRQFPAQCRPPLVPPKGQIFLRAVVAVAVTLLATTLLELGDPAHCEKPDAAEVDAVANTAEPDAETRHAVTRALPYLEEHGVAWIEEHDCVSCHQVPAMLWSMNEAAAHGIAVDGAKLGRWNRWSIDKLKEVSGDNIDGINQLILGRTSTSGERADFELLAKLIAEGQEDDGSWKADGQLPGQRRPEDETHRVSTLWSALALADIDDSSAALKRAQDYLEGMHDASGRSQEWLLVQWLYHRRFEGTDAGDAAKAKESLERIFAEQNDDGGWSWLLGEDSDALATGQTLWALERAGISPTEDAVVRARRYLLDTQEGDGSWTVHTTLSSEHGPMPTSNYWGTGWAVVGLLRSLPKT